MKSFSINEIARALKKAYPNIHAKVNSMIERGIFTKQTVGRSNLCTINLESEEARALLFLNKASNPSHKKTRSTPEIKTIIDRVKKIGIKKTVVSALIHKNKSNLSMNNHSSEEVIVIVDEKEDQKKIRGELGLLNLLLLTKNDFLQHCLERPSLLLNNNLFYGYENFYSILSENFDVLKASYERKINSTNNSRGGLDE